MKKAIIFVIFAAASFFAHSATNNIDNLYQVIEVDGVGNTTIRKGLLQQTRNAFE